MVKKEKKKEIISDLEKKIQKQKLIIFFDFTGIKTRELSQLRNELKETGNELKVVKKSLAQVAFSKAGFNVDFKKIKAQLAFVFGFKDEILPAKITWQFSEKNPSLKILGGIFEKNLISPERIVELAKLPTREELLAKLIGSIRAPISNFINVLQGNLRNLIFILSQIKVNQ